MLYSLNGEYPRPLPNRIRLSSGETRTTTFTAEEIANAGYTIVADPPILSRYEVLSWNGSEWAVTDPRTLENAKQIRLQDLKEVRQAAEKNLTWNGTFIYLDDKTQSRLDAGLKGMELAPEGTIISWEVETGTFVDFDQATLESLAYAAWNHIRLCFINAKTITSAISSSTTISQVDGVDLGTGWPGQ